MIVQQNVIKNPLFLTQTKGEIAQKDNWGRKLTKQICKPHQQSAEKSAKPTQENKQRTQDSGSPTV